MLASQRLMGRISVRLVLFSAAVLFFYSFGLADTPPHLHHDEVVIALQSHSIATTGRDMQGRWLPLYFEMPHVGENVWYQPTIEYVTALFLQVLPMSKGSLRLPTAMVATIDVILMFLVARRLFGSARWGWVAAILLAATPTHVVLGRVAFDFIYPLPYILGWLLAMLVYLERREPWRLFLATTILGAGFYSYVSSMGMMPIYLAMTLFLLFANQLLTVRSAAIAIAGFAWPLLLLVPWLFREPTFVGDVLQRYSVNETPTRFRFSAVVERVSLYWTFFNPAFLFLMGGFTHLTATTRLVGVFLLPFIVLIPLGLMQLVTVVRGGISVVLFAGFMLAPLAAVLTVQEPYASSRQLSILVFGVIIATYGLQRLWSWRSAAGRAVAVLVVALLPLHFAFFVQHYFGAYHGYAAAPFEWNHEDVLETIIELNPAERPQRVFLTAGHEKWIDAFWKLALAKTHREDLLQHTTYFDSEKLEGFDSIPPGAFVFVTVDDKALLEGVKSGAFVEIMRAAEPADDPVFFVLRRNPV
jgi:4-amino-4-deoxy-L-arabinose transferase-like glycosyltransferase